MAGRTFEDRNGRKWEIRARTKREWEFAPVEGNPERLRVVASPGYERDPFEMSNEELQRLLDGAEPPREKPRKSPFVD